MKVWFKCPCCGQNIAKIDNSKNIEGVFLSCKRCRNEVEVKNKLDCLFVREGAVSGGIHPRVGHHGGTWGPGAEVGGRKLGI